MIDPDLLKMSEKELEERSRKRYEKSFEVCGMRPLKRFSLPAGVYEFLYEREGKGATRPALIDAIKDHCEYWELQYSRQSAYRVLKSLKTKGYIVEEGGIYRIKGLELISSPAGDLKAGSDINKLCRILGRMLKVAKGESIKQRQRSGHPSQWYPLSYTYLAIVDDKPAALVGPALDEILSYCFSEIRAQHTHDCGGFEPEIDDLTVYKECHKVNTKFRRVIRDMKRQKMLYEDSSGFLVLPFKRFPWLYYADADLKKAIESASNEEKF